MFKVPLAEWNSSRPLQNYFLVPGRTFVDLDMVGIISVAFVTFEKLTDMMQEKTKRQAWLLFLEQIVFCYI